MRRRCPTITRVAPVGGQPAAFTLIELLIVVSIVALLVSSLLPGLSHARGQARAAVCASNLRQITLAVLLFADEHNNRACPGAASFLENLHRWHGTRDQTSEAFDPKRGPLARYLGGDGRIKSCPTFRGFVTDPTRAFELGNGGYGYNNAFVGRRLRYLGGGVYAVQTDRTGVQIDRIRRPAETVLFTDAAFTNSGVIEYSFAEPRFLPTTGFRAVPSIHFRHHHLSNVGWCDGHVEKRRRTFSATSPWYLGNPARFDIGWFGRQDDNRFFDLE